MLISNLISSDIVVMIVLFLVAMAFLLFGALLLGSEIQTRRNAVGVLGEVVGFQNSTGRNSKYPNFHTVARFQNFDGQTYYTVSTTSSTAPLNMLGDEVTVWIRKDNPSFAAIKSRVSTIVGGILLLVGVGLLIVFLKNFRLDLFSTVTTLLVLAAIGRGLWKAKRAVPLTKQQWMDLKGQNSKKTSYSEDEKDQIAWVSPDAIAVAFQNAKKQLQKAIPVCIVFAIATAVGSWFLYQKTSHFLKTAVATQGTVVEMVESHSSKSTTWAPMVEFIRPDTGQPHRFKHSVSSSPPSYSVGETVRVLYDPKNSIDARVDSGIWNYLPPVLLAGVSVLMLLITISNIRSLDRYSNPHRRRRSSVPRRPARGA